MLKNRKPIKNQYVLDFLFGGIAIIILAVITYKIFNP